VPMGAEPSFKLNQMFVAKFREILPMFAIWSWLLLPRARRGEYVVT
jgi:hypothetical protein